MKQTASMISTYSADTFGVCSALFELGGMIVIHDPSGCNSTYTTHDEPRWYDHDSLIYVSAMTERDAVLGDDRRLVHDIVTAARQQQPKFICLIPSQIAHLIGTDCRALCRIIEQKTGIPAFTLPTNSMHYYERGIFLALQHLAKQVISEVQPEKRKEKALSQPLTVNLLGVTPLDYGAASAVKSATNWLRQHQMQPGACWAMDCTLAAIRQSAQKADVNLVMSYGGLGAAHLLWGKMHIPYVCGTPLGRAGDELAAALASQHENAPCVLWPAGKKQEPQEPSAAPCFIIGETIFAQSLARALEIETGRHFQTIVPMETGPEILAGDTLLLCDEDELRPALKKAQLLIADPLYAPLVPDTCAFIPLPHRGFSGRTYERHLPDLMDAAAFHSFALEVQKHL